MSQTERLFYIDRRLRDNKPLSVQDVATYFEVDERTIKRDIEYLRDRLAAPVIWDRNSHTYRYTDDYSSLKFADEKMVLFYVFLRSMAANMHYVPLVSDDVLQSIAKHLSRDYKAVAELVRYETSEADPVVQDTLYTVVESMRTRHSMAIRYENSNGEVSERRIEPLRLLNYESRWYLLAWDRRHQSLRNFLLARFREASLTGEPYSNILQPADIEAHLQSGFGIFKTAAAGEVHLRFTGQAARIVKDQVWHTSQKLETVNEETLDMRLKSGESPELIGKVLRYGADAEIISPPELRHEWLRQIEAMKDKFLGK